jgi:Tfp pilus assembly protein PilO
MEKGVLALLIPILALMIPVSAIIVGGLTKIWRLRIEEAKLRSGAGDSPEVARLAAQVEQLRQELDEVHERLDFTERLLARTKDPGGLPGRE